MFRKPDGKLGFSFNRFITSAVPNFANSSDRDMELSAKQQDDLFNFQIGLAEPRVLAEHSFYIAGVVENINQSPKILTSLKKASILSEHPDDPTVYTSRISKNFPNQMATISVHRQRKLVCMLFFWEEELMRWKLLDDEQREIQGLLDEVTAQGGRENRSREEELRIALGRVQTRKNLAPSARHDDGTDNRKHTLPEYGQGTGTVGVLGGALRRNGANGQ
ncbi:hypothetical protein MMC30_001762 [Trapelia coarctata]|nr:hypothetical protein [Trapelia coarctata]